MFLLQKICHKVIFNYSITRHLNYNTNVYIISIYSTLPVLYYVLYSTVHFLHHII